jgi:diaminopimelate decarboxylase
VKYKSTIWGPTMDVIDKVCDDIELELLEINDVVYFLDAYTITTWTSLNCFEQTKSVYFINENDL